MQTKSSDVGLTVLLTAIAVGLGAMFLALFGAVPFAFYAMTLPVGLFLLWMARDVTGPDSRADAYLAREGEREAVTARLTERHA